MPGSRLQKLIWIGPVSGNVSLMVISVVAKIQALIVNLNSFGQQPLDYKGSGRVKQVI